MTGRKRRVVEAGLGLVMMVAAVAWLSGGCEDRVAPGEVALPPGEVISGGRIATGVERVAMPTTHTVAVRNPAMMTGSARGSSTRQSCCRSVIPTARAASMTEGSIPASRGIGS